MWGCTMRGSDLTEANPDGADLKGTPMAEDNDKPESRDLTETVSLWARLCSIIIVDLTSPASVPADRRRFPPEQERIGQLESGGGSNNASSTASGAWKSRIHPSRSVRRIG